MRLLGGLRGNIKDIEKMTEAYDNEVSSVDSSSLLSQLVQISTEIEKTEIKIKIHTKQRESK